MPVIKSHAEDMFVLFMLVAVPSIIGFLWVGHYLDSCCPNVSKKHYSNESKKRLLDQSNERGNERLEEEKKESFEAKAKRFKDMLLSFPTLKDNETPASQIYPDFDELLKEENTVFYNILQTFKFAKRPDQTKLFDYVLCNDRADWYEKMDNAGVFETGLFAIKKETKQSYLEMALNQGKQKIAKLLIDSYIWPRPEVLGFEDFKRLKNEGKISKEMNKRLNCSH